MEIAIIIVGGVVVTAFFASLFDYLGKKKIKYSKEIEKKVNEIEQKVKTLESRLIEKDDRIQQLEEEISFVNKVIEDKTK